MRSFQRRYSSAALSQVVFYPRASAVYVDNAHGNKELDLAKSPRVVVPCVVAPGAGAESASAERETRETRVTFYVDYSAANSAVEDCALIETTGAGAAQFEPIGRARLWRNPYTGRRAGIEIAARRREG